MTFNQWHAWTHEQRHWKKHFAQAEAQKKELLEEGKRAEAELQRLERAKWIEKIDIFTDKTYWQHEETGDIVHEEPSSNLSYVPRLDLSIITKK